MDRGEPMRAAPTSHGGHEVVERTGTVRRPSLCSLQFSHGSGIESEGRECRDSIARPATESPPRDRSRRRPDRSWVLDRDGARARAAREETRAGIDAGAGIDAAAASAGIHRAEREERAATAPRAGEAQSALSSDRGAARRADARCAGARCGAAHRAAVRCAAARRAAERARRRLDPAHVPGLHAGSALHSASALDLSVTRVVPRARTQAERCGAPLSRDRQRLRPRRHRGAHHGGSIRRAPARCVARGSKRVGRRGGGWKRAPQRNRGRNRGSRHHRASPGRFASSSCCRRRADGGACSGASRQADEGREAEGWNQQGPSQRCASGESVRQSGSQPRPGAPQRRSSQHAWRRDGRAAARTREQRRRAERRRSQASRSRKGGAVTLTSRR